MASDRCACQPGWTGPQCDQPVESSLAYAPGFLVTELVQGSARAPRVLPNLSIFVTDAFYTYSVRLAPHTLRCCLRTEAHATVALL